MPPDSWDDLRFVLALARAHSLSQAARALGVDQSTVGRRVAAFERAAGSRLFSRAGGSWALTAAGEAVQAHLEEIERRSLAVGRQLEGRDARLEGTVRLATSDSFASWFLAPRLRPLRARHPALRIELLTANRFMDLDRREADVALRFSRPSQPHLITRRVGKGGWALFASREYLNRHPKPPHDVVGFDDELKGTVGWRWLREHPELGSVVLTTNSMMAHAAAVAAGLGVGPVPCLWGDRQRSWRRVDGGVIGHHDIFLTVHPDVRHSARVRIVMDDLAALIRADAALVEGRQALAASGR
ncbi:MAG TPA: LysR family transcriptional regulator [Polyangia bacterium]|jgi:DNA-binding transcriptional LysR family regulator|nr:LysR family transcriptional regulator [Polyangia bacterium]